MGGEWSLTVDPSRDKVRFNRRLLSWDTSSSKRRMRSVSRAESRRKREDDSATTPPPRGRDRRASRGERAVWARPSLLGGARPGRVSYSHRSATPDWRQREQGNSRSHDNFRLRHSRQDRRTLCRFRGGGRSPLWSGSWSWSCSVGEGLLPLRSLRVGSDIGPSGDGASTCYVLCVALRKSVGAKKQGWVRGRRVDRRRRRDLVIEVVRWRFYQSI